MMARPDLFLAARVDGDVRRRSVQSTAMARSRLGFLQVGEKGGEEEHAVVGGALKLQGARERGGAVERPRRQGGRGHGARVSPVATVTMLTGGPTVRVFPFFQFQNFQQSFVLN